MNYHSGAPDFQEQLLRATKLSKNKQFEAAMPLFMELVHWPGEVRPGKLRRTADHKALECLAQLQDWTGLELLGQLARRRHGDLSWPHRFLGEALLRQARRKKARQHLERALEIDPENTEARVLLKFIDKPAPKRTRAVAGWPARQKSFKSVQQAIEGYLLRDRPREGFVGPDTVFMTLGSCFAQNLAQRLRAAGHNVNSEPLGEEVNSTYANRYLLQWIEEGAVDWPTKLMNEVYGEETRLRLRRSIEDSDVFVLTLGLAPCFFEADTGAFLFVPTRSKSGWQHVHANSVMRTTGVAENARNLGLIFDCIRRLAKRPPRFVLTVSPVPLAGTNEFGSAVEADCISKSTLRVACHEAVNAPENQDVIYWPSFEMVRWLGAHYGPEHPIVYGADDENTRHVSNWIVQIIIDLFLKHHAAPEARAAAE